MTLTNPMEQLAKWKALHGKPAPKEAKTKQAVENTPKNASIQTVEAKKGKTNATLLSNNKNAQNAKQGDFKGYAQTSRQFDLMKSAVERCKRDYPDCFHHKQQQAAESRQIAQNLRQGLKEWEKLAKGEQPNDQMMQQLHQFKQTVNYLAHHFDDVAKFIHQVNTALLT